MNWLNKRQLKKRMEVLLFSSKAELDRSLKVADEDPFLRGLLTLMNAQQQVHIEQGSVAGLPPDEAKAELRCVSALQDLEEMFLSRIAEARKFNPCRDEKEEQE